MAMRERFDRDPSLPPTLFERWQSLGI